MRSLQKKNESPAAFFLFLFVSLDSKVLLRGYVTLCWKTIKCSVFRCPGNASISSVLWFCLRFLATKRKTGERKKMGQTHFGYQATETESKSQRDNEESYGSSLSRQGSIKKKTTHRVKWAVNEPAVIGASLLEMGGGYRNQRQRLPVAARTEVSGCWKKRRWHCSSHTRATLS